MAVFVTPFFVLSVFLSGCFGILAAAAEPLVELRDCHLIPTAWADGDSFEIQTKEGARHTIRLYGADCIELHVNDESDARRLREQRRYFGISEFGGTVKTSIDSAKASGKSAAEETLLALSKPFTVHTAFADGLGDGKHKRIYAMVTTAAGEDLAERLVRLGLARAFGVYRETAAGRSAADQEAFLDDVELLAARKGAGVWAKTDWDRLPAERQEQRKEKAELALADDDAKAAADFKVDPNTAARDELMKLPGVGEAMANRIIQGRPYQKIPDLLNVEGIGPKTLDKLKGYFQLGGPG